MKRFLRGAFIMLLLVGVGVGVGTPAATAKLGSCHKVTLRIGLGLGLLNNQSVVGILCEPTDWAPGGHQVDLLVHGATYNKSYWDWPQPGGYSYVDAALAQGRATFAYDVLGAGESSRPLGALVTLDAVAYQMHRVVEWLRPSFAKISSVGHSIGSMIAVHEAAIYHDTDRLVLTGMLHSVGTGQLNAATSMYPAMLDPAFVGLLDPDYLTTLPAARGPLFYYAPSADPAVIAYDNAHKDVVSAVMFGTAIAEGQLPALINISRQITVPVLELAGDHDVLFCGGPLAVDCTNQAAVQAAEAPYFTGSPSLTARTVANTGHDLNLHTTAAGTFATINGWIASH